MAERDTCHGNMPWNKYAHAQKRYILYIFHVAAEVVHLNYFKLYIHIKPLELLSSQKGLQEGDISK